MPAGARFGQGAAENAVARRKVMVQRHGTIAAIENPRQRQELVDRQSAVVNHLSFGLSAFEKIVDPFLRLERFYFRRDFGDRRAWTGIDATTQIFKALNQAKTNPHPSLIKNSCSLKQRAIQLLPPSLVVQNSGARVNLPETYTVTLIAPLYHGGGTTVPHTKLHRIRLLPISWSQVRNSQ